MAHGGQLNPAVHRSRWFGRRTVALSKAVTAGGAYLPEGVAGSEGGTSEHLLARCLLGWGFASDLEHTSSAVLPVRKTSSFIETLLPQV
jgi:hypothetical protein